MKNPDRERLKRLLHAYELGTLSPAEEEEFELFLLEEPELFEQVRELESATHLMRNDPDVRELLESVIVDIDAANKAVPAREPIWKRLWPVYVAAAAALALFVLADWRLEFHPSSEVIASENRMAVMYFRDLSGQESESRWGEIATHLVVTDLSESRYIQVVSEDRITDLLESSGRTPGREMERQAAIEVARASNSRWLLIGNVLQTQPTFVISSQLIDTKSGDITSAQEAHGGTGQDIFGVVDQLTAQIRTDMALPSWTRQETDPSVAEVTTHSSDAYRYYLAGLKYYNMFYFVEAWNEFRKAVLLDSTFAIAYLYLHRLGDPGALDKALHYMKQASQRDQVYIRMGEAVANGDYRKAIAELKLAIRRFPDYKEFYHNLATYYRLVGDYENAARQAQKAIEMDPLYKEAYNGLAYIYIFSGQADSAIQTVNKLVAIAPDEANSWDSKGEIYMSLGMIDEAKAAFEHALQIKPDFHNSAFSLGLIAVRDGDYETATRLFESQAEQKNIFARSRLRTLEVLLREAQGKYREALEMLDLQIEKDSLEFAANGFPLTAGQRRYMRLAQARIYTELGDRESALRATRQTIDILKSEPVHPSWQAFYISLGQLLAVNGDTTSLDRLIRQWRFGLREDSKREQLIQHLEGAIAFSTGDWRSVIADLEPACDQLYDTYSILLLAKAYLNLQKPGQAIQWLEKSLNLWVMGYHAKYCSYQAETYFLLGLAYEQAGDTAKARMNFERFLERWKNADPGLEMLEETRTRLANLTIAN